MSEQELRIYITEMFRAKPIMESINENDDFFDLGASSLTVVDLQLDIESKLGVTVSTSELMKHPSINGWVAAYAEKVSKLIPTA